MAEQSHIDKILETGVKEIDNGDKRIQHFSVNELLRAKGMAEKGGSLLVVQSTFDNGRRK